MNTTLRSLFVTMAAGAVAVGALTALPALAQEGEAPAAHQAERFRHALTNRLDEIRTRQGELESLLSRLDAGESTDELRRAMREALATGVQRHLVHVGQGEPAGEHPTRAHIEGLMLVLGEIDPDMRVRIRRAMADNPEHARRMVEHASPRLREMADMHERNPEQFRARVETLRAARESFDIARRLNQAVRDGAEAAEVGRLRAELLESVARRIDLETQERQASIESMAERLESLRNELATMRAEREAMIVRQAQRLEETAGGEPGKGGQAMRRQRPGAQGEPGRPDGPRPRDAQRPGQRR